MAYLVRITSRAERDLFDLFHEVHADDVDAARNWYFGLKDAISSLQVQPNRCPVIRKTGKLRHLLYGRKPNVYRVIYRVLQKQKCVEVLHIRHGARKNLVGSCGR